MAVTGGGGGVSRVWRGFRERERERERGVYYLFTVFDTIVGVRGPNYGYVCRSLLHVGFQEKLCLKLMGCDIFSIDE